MGIQSSGNKDFQLKIIAYYITLIPTSYQRPSTLYMLSFDPTHVRVFVFHATSWHRRSENYL